MSTPLRTAVLLSLPWLAGWLMAPSQPPTPAGSPEMASAAGSASVWLSRGTSSNRDCGRAGPEASDPDPRGCGSCHGEIHDEWRASAHARAFTDPEFQRAIEDLEHPERCVRCHAPTDVLPRFGRIPEVRTVGQEHGVWCGTCHFDRDDLIAGPFGAEHDDHASRKHPAFQADRSDLLCGTCHDLRIGPVLPLARDFRASGLARGGTSCVTCHMAEVTRVVGDGGPERRGRRHTLLGPSDPDFAASAFAVSLARDDDDNLELLIENRAGHRVPGLTTREFVFSVQHRDGTDRVVLSAENPLYQGELRRFPFPVKVRGDVSVVVSHRHLDRTEEILRLTDRL